MKKRTDRETHGRLASFGWSLLLIAFAAPAAASSFNCVAGASPYCVYEGVISEVYVNDSGRVLIYWDAEVRSSVAVAAADVGLQVQNPAAAAVDIPDNPQFADYLSTFALAAHLSGRRIRLQMRGTVGAYLKIDRIWVEG